MNVCGISSGQAAGTWNGNKQVGSSIQRLLRKNGESYSKELGRNQTNAGNKNKCLEREVGVT